MGLLDFLRGKRTDNQPNVAASPQQPSSAPSYTTYTVRAGDTLSKIAKEQLGDASKYRLIFERNRGTISDPNKIYPGQVLQIPKAA